MVRDDATTLVDDSYSMGNPVEWLHQIKTVKAKRKAKQALYVFDDRGCKMLPPPKWNEV
jgi:hypothetical protein